MPALPQTPEYLTFLEELKARVRAAQVRAALAVNQELVLLYWGIGRDILARQQALDEGKPENIVDKIVEGRVASLLKEQVLLNQPFVKDASKTIAQLITEASARTGEKIEVGRFTRFQIG